MLIWKAGGPTLSPQNLYEQKPSMVAHTSGSSLGAEGTETRIGILPGRLVYLVSSRPGSDLVQKNKVGHIPEERHLRLFSDLTHMHTHTLARTCPCTHTNMHTNTTTSLYKHTSCICKHTPKLTKPVFQDLTERRNLRFSYPN